MTNWRAWRLDLAWLEARVMRLTGRLPPSAWLFLLCLAFVYPAITMTSAHFEEGTTIGLARGAFEDGHWLTPYRYGLRFPERPDLVSLLLGLIGRAIGVMPDWLPRLFVFAALYGGAWLVHRMVSAYARPLAAAFAVVAFLASPLVLPKLVTAEVDIIVATLEFAAVYLWWFSPARGSPSGPRILAIGAVLAVAGLVKGPQPLGFFFTGLGVFLLVQRRWADLARLVVIGLVPLAVLGAWYAAVYEPGDMGNWLGHSRITTLPPGNWIFGSLHLAVVFALVYLPAILVIAPALRKARWAGEGEARSLFLALLGYSLVATAALIAWPSANERYAMPAILGIAAAGGLAFAPVMRAGADWARAGVIVAGLLMAYVAVLHAVVQPLMPDLFQPSRTAGRAIAAVIAERPATLRASHQANHLNLWVYVRSPVRNAPIEAIMAERDGFWAAVSPAEEQAWRAAQPDRAMEGVLSGPWPYPWRLLRVAPLSP